MILQSYQQFDRDNKNLKHKILSHYMLKLLYLALFLPKNQKIKENNVIRAVLPYGSHYSIVSLQSYWQMLTF